MKGLVAATAGIVRLVGLAVALAGPGDRIARAQGFAGLGTRADGFAQARAEIRPVFPRDHGPHPDFRIEWWYLTANLRDAEGRDFGIQWTLFRMALRPGEADGWQSPQLWMGHAAVTSADAHRFAERRARGGIGQAGVRLDPFTAWIDDWAMTGADDLSRLRLAARGRDWSYDLELDANGPIVLHGNAGFSVKSPNGQASHYYSQPHYRVSGRLTLSGGEIEVRGGGWLDREWSSQPLSADQDGWDWFSLHFDSGEKLMAFRLRGGGGDFTAATWIDPNGEATALPEGTFRAEPLEPAGQGGTRAPVRWRIRLPDKGLDAVVEALNPHAWMETSVPYWEGPVRVNGSHPGVGYLEMTGYD